MSDGFVKVYTEMLDSSIWGESIETRIVWITMLAMADGDGIVSASVGGLARRANVSREATEAALEVLAGPDPDSRDGTTGERIEKRVGGWAILNHRKYRDRRSKKQRADAERQAAKRKRDKSRESRESRQVTPSHAPSRAVAPEAEAEAEAEAYTTPSESSTRVPPAEIRRLFEEAAERATGVRPSVVGIQAQDAEKLSAHHSRERIEAELSAFERWLGARGRPPKYAWLTWIQRFGTWGNTRGGVARARSHEDFADVPSAEEQLRQQGLM